MVDPFRDWSTIKRNITQTWDMNRKVFTVRKKFFVFGFFLGIIDLALYNFCIMNEPAALFPKLHIGLSLYKPLIPL